MCLDGVGEWTTTSAWIGDGKELEPLWEIDFPHSLGLLYSAFTYFTGLTMTNNRFARLFDGPPRKKFWMAPIIIVLLLLGVLIVLVASISPLPRSR